MPAVPDTTMRMEKILTILRSQYPGWAGFDNPAFTRDEIEYKKATIDKAKRELAEPELRTLLDTAQYDEIIRRLDVIGKDNNLLYRSTPTQGDLNILYRDNLDKEGLCSAIFDLLYGEGDSPERLGRYLAWGRRAGLPSKWTFPTYFLFIVHPETEIFIKPETTKAFLGLLGIDDEIRGEVTPGQYSRVREIAHSLMKNLTAFEPRDMVDIQSIFWVCGRAVLKRLVDQERRAEFKSLFEEFVTAYPSTPAGRKHISLYTSSREQARANFELLRGAVAHGEDVTDRVLLLLLPHRDSPGNRERGAWIHYAPAVSKDLKSVFEGARWVRSEDGPQVASAIWKLVESCVDHPDQLEAACRQFQSSAGKGLPTDMLTPVLNALRPDSFLLVNAKTRLTLNYLTRRKFAQSLDEYPKANETLFRLVEELSARMTYPRSPDLRTSDLFDMFCHWLVAVKKFSFDGLRYWKIAPGAEAWQWEKCKEGGFIAIGWDRIGDVSGLAHDQFEARRIEIEREDPDYTQKGAGQVWTFSQIREGDRIIANRGTKEVVGVGTVTGPYYFVPGVPHGHRLRVEWEDVGTRSVDQPRWTSTLQTVKRDLFEEIVNYSGLPATETSAGELSKLEIQEPYPLPQCGAATGMDLETLTRWVRVLERKGQAILYGPPGTGKTHMALELARHLVGGGDGFRELVQFHPSYGYEEFIQGIRPEPRPEGGLDYPLKKGRFFEFCERAQDREGRCVLIIDEINRANLSRVFGELMYLLEYRDEEIPLAAGRRFSIPPNVRILGTMNTADRSIALVDHALRRRFAFFGLRPNFDILRRFHNGDELAERLISVLGQVNREIGNPHYEVGITFFLNKDLSPHLEDIWRMEILPYLEEYFFDQPEKFERFRWQRVREDLGL